MLNNAVSRNLSAPAAKPDEEQDPFTFADAMGNVTWAPHLVQDEPRLTLALTVKL
jgi:hypothetical protein